MSWYSDKETPSKWALERFGDGLDDSRPCVHCEACKHYREEFDIDDFGNTIDFCKCGLTDDLLDTTERECVDFKSC